MPARVLLPHQKKMLTYMMRKKHPALFVDMRLGKTLVVVRRLMMIPWCTPILVVCPYSAFSSWKKELRLECDTAPVELTVDNKTAWNPRTQKRWFVTNKESFLSLQWIQDISWGAVVIDESRFIANPKAKVSKFYVNHFRNAVHRIVLTGSPATEGEHEYFQQLQFLSKDYFGFKNFWEFRAKLFEPELYGRGWKPTAEGKKYINLVLAAHCFFLKKKDVGLGNIHIYEQRHCQLSKPARKMYKTLAEEFVLEQGAKVSKTVYATSTYIWKRRLCGGSVNGKFIFDHKTSLLFELLEGELSQESVVVWCAFIEEIEYLSAEFSKRQMSHRMVHGSSPRLKGDRDIYIEDFQSGRVQYLIGHPECFKHSVELYRASTMIFYSTIEGLETREQVEARIEVPPAVRRSKEPLLYIDLIVENTIEEDINTSIVLKEAREMATRRIVKRLQEEATDA
jgi:SNF2 family DNA or RNA helicase